MHRLAPSLWPEMRRRLGEDRAGVLLAPHMLHSGLGEWWVDAWPEPRAFLLFVGGNAALQGDRAAADPEFLAAFVSERLRSWDRIFIDVPDDWELAVQGAIGPLQRWPRVILQRPAGAPLPRPADTAALRRLTAEDASELSTLSEEIRWIGDPWGGLEGLARSGRGWGAWSAGRLASVAAAGLVGDLVEDVFVVTEPDFRGRGLCPQCAARVIDDVARKGKAATWTTWPRNTASRRVAAKLGFVQVREDHAWIAGQPL